MANAYLNGSNLSKFYGNRTIFKNLNLHLDAGVHALVGPNGQGKSTLLRMLSGSEPLTEGVVDVCGFGLAENPQSSRAELSYVPDGNIIYPYLKVHEFLEFVRNIRFQAKKFDLETDRKMQAFILEHFALTGALNKRLDAVSYGMQRKTLLASGFIGTPRVLIFDEPNNGLDDSADTFLAELICEYRPNCVIFFSCHDPAFIAKCKAIIWKIEEDVNSAAAYKLSKVNAEDISKRPL